MGRKGVLATNIKLKFMFLEEDTMDTILLIADEDQRVKNIVRFTFEQMDYKVLSTSSGADAVSMAKEIKPDIVLVDVSLQDKNGYDVSREIKNNPILKNTPVILLISSFVTFNETKVAESLADDFIIKPFVFEEIIKKIKSLTVQGRYRIKPPMILNRERKEMFVKAMLTLFFISLLTTPILYLKGRPNPPKVESNLKQPYGQLKNDSGSNKLLVVKSNAVSFPEKGQKVTITINEKGEIFISDAKYALSELKFETSKLIGNLGKQIEDQVVFLKADASLPYGKVMKVAAEIKKVGVKRLELDTEPVLLSKSEQLGDRETEKENSKTSPNNELPVSRELAKIYVAKQEKPKVIYTVLANTNKENGGKTPNGLKLTETSTTSPPKETEDKQVASKELINRAIGESKKKVEAKKGSREEQIKTSRTAKKEVSDKLKKTAAKKEIPKHKKTSIKEQLDVKGNKYVVKKGESLWSISKKFNTSVKDLKVANKLKGNNIHYGKVLIVPGVKEEPQNNVAKLQRKKNSFSKDIKITDWSLYVAWGLPTIHNVTIENTSNTTYANIKIKALYYYSYSTDSVKLETGEIEGTLPITVPPYSKKTYLQNGITLKQGSACSMFGGAKEIHIIGANAVRKDLNLYSLR